MHIKPTPLRFSPFLFCSPAPTPSKASYRSSRRSIVNPRSLTQLENNRMRELALRETPRCTEVFGNVGSLLDFGNEVVVDVFLVLCLRFGEGLFRLRLATLKELFLGGEALLRLRLSKVLVVDLVVNLNAGE